MVVVYGFDEYVLFGFVGGLFDVVVGLVIEISYFSLGLGCIYYFRVFWWVSVVRVFIVFEYVVLVL